MTTAAQTLFAAVTASDTPMNADMAQDDTTVIRVLGTVQAGIAGNLQFQFANNAAGGGRVTTVKANSFLKIQPFP